jgi:hypothetical protein
MAKNETYDDKNTEAVIFKVEFCKALCSQYGECENISKNLTKDRSETLVAPCHWNDGGAKTNSKRN